MGSYRSKNKIQARNKPHKVTKNKKRINQETIKMVLIKMILLENNRKILQMIILRKWELKRDLRSWKRKLRTLMVKILKERNNKSDSQKIMLF